MTASLLTLALLAQPQCRIPPARAAVLAPVILEAERAHALPPGLLAAVVLAESGGRNLTSRPRFDGKRDHGPAQIHASVAPQPWPVGLLEGARLLARSRARCAAHPTWRACRRGAYALYNAGSLKWSRRVAAIWARLLAAAEAS
jgi:hypothetical protein